MSNLIQTAMLSLGAFTLTGVMLTVIAMAADKVFGERYSAMCRYAVWTLIVLRMCLPFSLEVMPEVLKLTLPEALTVSGTGGAVTELRGVGGTGDIGMSTDGASDGSPVQSIPMTDKEPQHVGTPSVMPDSAIGGEVNEGFSHNEPIYGNTVIDEKHVSLETGTVLKYTFVIWLAGAVTVLCARALGYAVYSNRIRHSIAEADDGAREILMSVAAELGIAEKRLPSLCIGKADTPMLFGFINPVLLLPEGHMSGRQLRGILRHELIHLKRRDLWIKLACMVAMAVNWFNPFAYIAASKCIRAMELSCDEAVLKGAEAEERIEYGRLMLEMIGRGRGTRSLLTTRFEPKKSAIVERFANIFEDKKKKRGLVIIVAALVLCAVSAVGVIGIVVEPSQSKHSDSESHTSDTDLRETEGTEDDTNESESTAPEPIETEGLESTTLESMSGEEPPRETYGETVGPVEAPSSSDPVEIPSELRCAYTVWAFGSDGKFYGQGTDCEGELGSADGYAAALEYVLPEGITAEDVFVTLYRVDPDAAGVPAYPYELEGEGSVTNKVTLESVESFTTTNGYAAEYKRIHEEGVFLRHTYNVRVTAQNAVNISFKSSVGEDVEGICRGIVDSVKYTDLSEYPTELSRDRLTALLRELAQREKLANSAYFLPLDTSAAALTNEAGDSFLPYADNEYGIRTEDDLMRFVNMLTFGYERPSTGLYTGDIYSEADGKLVNIGQRWMVVDGVIYRNTSAEHSVNNEATPDYESIEEYGLYQNSVSVTWDSDGDGAAEEMEYRLADGKLYLE